MRSRVMVESELFESEIIVMIINIQRKITQKGIR